jgi:hypothetical protein
VRDADPERVDKAFTAPLVELALASYPGFTLTAPPGRATPYGVYRPAFIPREAVQPRAVLDGRALDVLADRTAQPERSGEALARVRRASEERASGCPRRSVPAESGGRLPVRRVPFGRVVHARSGDKGGDANVGVWAIDAAARPDRAAWLIGFLTPDVVRTLLPETRELDVQVYPLPNLGGVNVVVRGLLGEGVAASSRFDPQAKALGEWLRSRHVDVPEDLL